MEFGCIRRAGEPVSPPEQMFMEFLKKELDFCIRRAGEPVSPPEQMFMEFLKKELDFLDKKE